MIKKSVTTSLLLVTLLFVGCAKSEMKAPCPNYGKQCAQTPINSWNY